METTSSKSVIPVFLFFLLLLSGWFTYSTIGDIKALQTISWPTTRGTVISSEVKRGTSSKGSPKYSPVIFYSYQIGTVEYQSNRYSSTNARGTSDWARQVVSRYPANRTITVYYNPKDPKKSVLETGLHSDDYWMTLFSSFFIFVVLLAFIKQIKNRRTNLSEEEILWQETERK
jgi:hypothetical protein